jgi:hypothetical protein
MSSYTQENPRRCGLVLERQLGRELHGPRGRLAGWHTAFDVLDRLLSGNPIGRIVGVEAMKFGGWQRLNVEYAKQFGFETPGWPTNAPKR